MSELLVSRRASWVVRRIAWCLAIFLAIPSSFEAAPRQVESSSLRIEVLEGNGALNNIATERARDIVVRVVGSDNQPVEGAVVSFVFPVSGPGATFPNGARTSSVPTDARGVAAARELRLNDVDGQFEVRVSAAYQGQTARTNVLQTNVRPAGGSRGVPRVLLIVGLIAGAAAGAAVALGGSGGGNSNPAPAPGPNPSPTTITPGAPIFGSP